MASDTGIAGYASLGANVNKRKNETTEETREGVASEKLPELTLEMSNEDLVKLTEKWEKVWKDSPKRAEWEKQGEEAEKYWIGKQFDMPANAKFSDRAMVDNLIFESLETYLPQITRRNPEAVVELRSHEKEEDGTENPVKTKYKEKLKNKLNDLADDLKLRLRLKRVGRHWSIFLIGVGKIGWDLDKDSPTVKIIRPKKVILDPDATIDESGYSGNRIGEYRKMDASDLKSIIEAGSDEQTKPDAIKAIDDLVKEDTGTEIQFTEWWTPKYICWKLGSTILLKKNNPHWNYDKTETPDVNNIADENVSVDEYGNPTAPESVEIKGINHFVSPKMPFVFLTMFSLDDQPMDKTSLISQNLANQDKINKRNKQIDKNTDKMNGGVVVSLARSGLTETQAKGVADAVRKGGAVIIPDGAPQDAVYFPQVPSLPSDVYNDLVDTRNRLRDIFGVSGSTQAGIRDEKTVRGKILARGFDTDRIGGGISEQLEQFADDVYNWFVQMLYVYDADYQFLGDARPPKVKVSVVEGSLLPKDSTTIANQAIELGTVGKMAVVDMYRRLEYPNPEELAANLWLEQNAPHILYADNPMIQQAIMEQQMMAQQEQMQVKENKMNEKQVSHQNEMEKESIKQGRDLLSEVDIEQ